MKKVFVAHVITQSLDHYLYAFVSKPSTKDVCKLVMDREGGEGDLSDYEDSVSIDIQQCEIIKGKKK